MARKVRSLGFGSRKDIKGHLHRSHRAAKNQKKFDKPMVYLREDRRRSSEDQKKWSRELVRKEKLRIRDSSLQKHRVY